MKRTFSLDDVPTDKVLTFESGLHGFMSSKYKAVMDDIEKTLALSEDGEKVFNDGKGIYLSKPIIQELVKESIHIHKDTTTATTDAVPAPTAPT